LKSTSTSDVRSKISAFLVLLLFTLYLALIYASGFFKDWQELVTESYLILRGLKNYTDIATHHAPLLTEFLAVIFKVAGTNIIVRKILLFIISIATAFLTYRATRQLAGKRAGLYSILLFAILWPFYGGTNFWFDTFLPIFYLFAFVLIIEKHSLGWLVLAGISMGLSFLIKQLGGVVALVIFIMLLLRPKPIRTRLKEGLVFSAGVLTPLIIVALWYTFTGQIGEAYYWIIKYNLSGHYMHLGRIRPPNKDIIRLIVINIPIMLFLIGATFSKAKRQLISWNFLLALAMGFFASFTILPRWERWHAAPAIPFLVISLVLSYKFLVASTGKSDGKGNKKIVKIILTFWIIGVFSDVGMFYPPMLIEKIVPNFSQLWPLGSYAPPAWYDEHFRRYVHDIPELGKYLQKVTSESERIFAWGWLGNKLYFESNRLPSGKLYYALPWFTCLPQFKRDLLLGFEHEPPRFVIISKITYPGMPTLKELGVDLDKKGYKRLPELEDRFPEVVIWRSYNP